jgi:hypothetical protein
MKKLLSILFLLAAFVATSQNLIQVTATKAYDGKGNSVSNTTSTVYISKANISNVNNSSTGSIIYLINPILTSNGVVASYSTASTPAQVAALVSSTNVSSPVTTAYTTSATVTASDLAGGLLSNTGTVAITLTLPTTSLIAAQVGATTGSILEFAVLNNASGGTVTMAVGSGMTASDFPGTNTLTRTASATVGIARFRITFLSASASILTRIN